MKQNVNLYPIYYGMLIQLGKLRSKKEQLSDTIQRVLSDKKSSEEDKILVHWIREYSDSIPYEKGVKEKLLDKILFVKDIDKIQNIPFETTRYGYKSIVYQAINTKKLIEELILKGIYPQNYFQSKTKWRGSNACLSQEEKDSRELQVLHCVDHSILRDFENNYAFLEVFRRTGLSPTIEIRNAHTGKNACFMIISLMNTDFRSFGLRSSYHADSLFGVRLEHRDLGSDYVGVYSAIDKLSGQYGQLVDIIVRMQGQYLLDDQREIMKNEIAKLIFGKMFDHYKYDLDHFFDGKFQDRKSLWERMLFIQDKLYTEISYTFITKNGNRINRKKRISDLKWNSRQKILGRLFELFELQLQD